MGLMNKSNTNALQNKSGVNLNLHTLMLNKGSKCKCNIQEDSTLLKNEDELSMNSDENVPAQI